jgi:hypothetical protein
MTLREELEQMFREQTTSNPILREAQDRLPGESIPVPGEGLEPIRALLAAHARFDDALLGLVWRLADAVDAINAR